MAPFSPPCLTPWLLLYGLCSALLCWAGCTDKLENSFSFPALRGAVFYNFFSHSVEKFGTVNCVFMMGSLQNRPPLGLCPWISEKWLKIRVIRFILSQDFYMYVLPSAFMIINSSRFYMCSVIVVVVKWSISVLWRNQLHMRIIVF